MANEVSLVDKLGGVVAHVKAIERERDEAIAQIKSLEREVNDLRTLIAMAESKAEEIMGPVSAAAPQDGTSPAADKELQPALGKTATQAQGELKKAYRQPFSYS